MAGSNDFSRSIRDFSNRIGRLAEQKEVRLVDLYHDHFISQHTNCPSLQAFVDASAWKDTPVEEFAVVLESEEWNQYVIANTSFESSRQMMEVAVAEWARRVVAQP